MADKPILFSAPMIRALLDGRKTQTRRVLRNPEYYGCPTGDCPHMQQAECDAAMQENALPDVRFKPGDRLWVREAWRAHRSWNAEKPRDVIACSRIWFEADRDNCDQRGKLRSGRYMPRWASRLTLLVTDVRVQRLQDMEGQHPSDSDAIAEGVRAIHHGDGDYYYSAFRDQPHPQNWCDPVDAFRELWNSINGPDAWAQNPWVAAVSFDVVRANIDQVKP